MGGFLLDASGWVFLAGVVLVLISALPPVAQRRGRLMGIGFLLAVASLALVFLGWWLQRA